jgi:hypothetical protein
MANAETHVISSDDHLWIASNIPWRDAEDNDIKKLLMNPHQWVKDAGIDYRDSQGDLRPVQVADSFFVFLKHPITGPADRYVVQGIHGTGMITVQGMKSEGLAKTESEATAELETKVEVTFVEDSNKAYIHLQIGTDPELIADHLMAVASDESAFLAYVNRRYVVDGSLTLVDAKNDRIDVTHDPKYKAVIFEGNESGYVDSYYEGIKVANGSESTQSDPRVPACNALIGTYILVNGQIVVVPNTGFVKRYLE